MTGVSLPLIEFVDVVKHYGGPEPFRVQRLSVGATDAVALSGLDEGAAEMFIHLVTGASVPESGVIRIAGTDTRAIATDTEWLVSLDRFGLVTNRAILIEKLSIASNLALPMTLAIDPMTEATRARVDALADAVELPAARLDEPATTLTDIERARVHLARALAMPATLILLERPTSRLPDAAASAEFGRVLRSAATSHAMGWLAVTDDTAFAGATGGVQLHLDAATGKVSRRGFWHRFRQPRARS